MPVTAPDFKFRDADTILRLRLVQQREEEDHHASVYRKWRYCVEMSEYERATRTQWRAVFKLHVPRSLERFRHALKSRWGVCPMTRAAWQWALECRAATPK